MNSVQSFLACRRVALIGVSRNPADFSRSLLKEFLARGYDAIAVNPSVEEIEGRPCYPTVSAMAMPVEGALVITAAAKSAEVVRECIDAGIRKIWLFRAGGKGAVSEEALALCRDNGVEVVPGACPYMYFPNAQWFHRVHGFIARLTGQAA